MRQTLAWILGKGGSQADLPSCLVCEGEEDCRRDPMWNSDWGAKLPSYLAAAGYSERQCYTSMSQTVVGLFVKKRNGDHAHNCFSFQITQIISNSDQWHTLKWVECGYSWEYSQFKWDIRKMLLLF